MCNHQLIVSGQSGQPYSVDLTMSMHIIVSVGYFDNIILVK